MLNVTVVRVGVSDGTVSVQYKTLDGASGLPTAWAGADYSSKSGTITFAPGETVKTITILITNDSSVEQNEAFRVQLLNPTGGATLGSITTTVATIMEDDSAIEFAQSSYTVSEGAGFVEIKLVRKGSRAGTATVDLNISSGAAGAGSDFIKPANPTVVFADGESEKTIKIQLIDDAIVEASEYFYLSLLNATGPKLGSYLWGNVTITDND